MSGLDRYQNPELYDRLAAAYVLGTLSGQARRRFETLVLERPYLAAAVAGWEARLDPLAETAPEVAPPARVWKRLQQEVGATAPVEPRESIWQRLGFWQFATAFSVGLLAVSLLMPLRHEAVEGDMPMPEYVAVLEKEGAGPMMVATAAGKPWTLTVALMVDMDMPDTEQMRLWCYPADGGPPVPMGLVTTDEYTTFQLSQADWDGMASMSKLGISVEPMGADEPEPMGPMKYIGELKPLRI
jgi:anti-sigma-K factor RskA